MWKPVVGLVFLANLCFVIPTEGSRPRCPKNETLDPCYSGCPPRYCGVNIAAISCAPISQEDCVARCRCIDGYLRDKNGKCIREEDCPTCTQENTVYDVCIKDCPPRTCEIDDRLVLILCAEQPEPGDKNCKAGCRCADGYVKRSDGACVTREECPPQCPDDEEYAECPPAVCAPKTCDDVGYPVACPDIIGPCPEKPACLCREGLVRDCSGKCIPMKDCPSCAGDVNAVSDECGNYCGTRCSDLENSNQTTTCKTAPSPPPCPCEYNGCICKSGYYYSEEKGECVSANECTSPCPKNETLDPCYSDCPPLYCGENIAAILCLAIDPEDCKPGCRCKDGYRRDAKGNCILEEDCPKCPENERYYVCDSPCPGRDCSVDPRLVRCTEPPKPGDDDCVIGCNCIEGYARDASGKCIPREQCPKCTKPHEIYKKCIPSCPPPRSCDNIDKRYHCPKQAKDSSNCMDGFVCESGYYRNYIGDCITAEDCRKCENDDNSYFSCGGACDNVCRTLSKQNQTHCPIYTFVCVPMCYCKPGYAENDSGICIPIEDCPPECGPYEEYVSSPSTVCRPQKCSEVGQPVTCAPYDPDRKEDSACICIEGYARDSSSQCVPIQNCSNYCGPNQVYDNCSNARCVRRRCFEYPAFCSEIDPSECTGGCVCAPGYYIKDNEYECVPESECIPPECPKYEEWSTCYNGGCDMRKCSELGGGTVCRDPIMCYGGCVCIKGYLRNEDGVCVPIDQCPPPTCGANETYSKCSNGGCGPWYCSDVNHPTGCVKMDQANCRPGCVCKDGYVRNDYGDCIEISDCDGVCGVNEVLSRCANQRCDIEYCTELGQPVRPCREIDEDDCRIGCVCMNEYYRNSNGTCVPEDQCDHCNKAHEHYEPCAKPCPPEPTCDTIGVVYKCRYYEECLKQCRCDNGYYRNSAGQCVTEQQCNQCNGPNEYFACGGACDNVCATLQEQNQTYCPIINIKCNDMCYCDEGYARDLNNICIPIEDCQVPICGENERFEQCPPALCIPQKCSELGYPVSCPASILPPDPSNCPEPSGCVCIDNYVRDDSGECIPKEQCPSCGGDPNAVSGCGVNCGRLCSNYNQTDVACILICYDNACDCREGFVYDENTKTCVRPEECTPTCKENEVYDFCANNPCGYRYCSQLGQPQFCKDGPECIGDCICQDGYLRADNGTCIQQNECPVPTCGENERFEQCPDAICQPQSCSEVGFLKPCPLTDGSCSGPGACVCDYDYVRDDNGKCIPKRECPSCGGDPNAISGCGVNCGRLCSNYDKGPVPCPRICYPEACDCRDGFVLDENTRQCVVPEECTPICQENEVYSSCTNGGCGPKNCSELGGPIRCVKIDPRYCKKGCICAEGYLRDSNGICVPEKQCDNCNGPYEYYDSCAPICPPQTCESIGKRYNCPIMPQVCRGACRCEKGYFRNAIGECISKKQCQLCNGPNEYFSCGGACDNVCATLQQQNQTNCPIINIKCNPMCYCEEGYARDSNNICIPIEECPAPQCGENERLEQCPPLLCAPQKCSDLGFPIECPDLIDGDGCPEPPGCVCIDNYVRDDTGKCIPSRKCPSCGGDPNAVSGCGVNCGRLCSNYNLTDVACIEICYINACDCRKGFVYDENTKQCVRPKDCTPTCGENEVYDICANGGCSKRDCSQLGQPDYCIDVLECYGGCVCRDGYLRETNGICVPVDECTEPTCGVNERYEKCPGLSCEPQTCSELGFPKDCPLDYSAASSTACFGPPACVCDYNYVRDDNGICIPKNECPSCGGDPNAVSGCGVNCGRLCSNYKKKNVVCPLICKLNGCDCKKGYVYDSNRKKCVRPRDCFIDQPICIENEVYNDCVSNACEIRNCSQVGEPQLCLADIKCYEGCVCRDGYLRTDDGVCVPQDQCPLQCMQSHEVYDPCPYSCPPQTCNSIGIAYSCAAPPTDENGDRICHGACRCESGYYRNSIGECISEEDCSKCNGPNEYYSSCGGPCDNVCATIDTQSQTNCPIKNKRCYAQCYCDEGYARDDNNICVPIDQCPSTTCGQNEIYSGCANSGCRRRTCSDPGILCIDPIECIGDCICLEGYLRDDDGNCIPEDQCPSKCDGPNEYYAQCGGPCDNVCATINTQNQTNCPISIEICFSQCYCEDGYARDNNNICIPIDQCEVSCNGDSNAVPGCGINCGRRCSNYDKEPKITCAAVCRIDGCDCKQGYVYDDNIQQCVLPNDCTPVCGQYEVYDSCANGGCSRRKCSDSGIICRRPKKCIGDCVCIGGYSQNDDGVCVPENECNPTCPENEVYDGCANGRCQRRKCSELGDAIPCYDVNECIGDCVCAEGYLRNEDGICVLESQCYPQCGPNEVFDSCPYTCPPRTCESLQRAYICPIKSDEEESCTPSCVCKYGYFRNKIGECISEEDCLQCMGPNEYFSCGVACDNVCSTLSKQNQTNCPIINVDCNRICYCEEGYARNAINICIPISDCPDFRCGEYERYIEDPSLICEPRTCEELGFELKCTSVDRPTDPPGCYCKQGFVRSDCGSCIQKKNCPSCGGDPNAQAGCGNCAKTCSTYGKDVSCITVCYENACDCKDGFVLDEVIGKCVRFEDCTTTDPQPPVNETDARIRLELGEIKLSGEFLYQLVSSEPEANAVSSATSVLIPLAQLALFCEGRVLEELLTVLNLRSKDEIRAVFPLLTEDYKSQKNVEFEVATKYYADDDYPLSYEFIEESQKYFEAEGENVNFSDNVDASDTINAWVEEKTRGKITDLVSPDMFNQDTRFALVNAIYFLGDWVNQFNPDNTETKDFTKSNGDVVSLEIMYQQKSFRYSENDQYQVLELPYLGGNFTFLIVLPRKYDGLLETVKTLRDPKVFKNTVDNLRTEKVQVYLPKMDIQKQMDMAEMLQKANVTAIFDPQNNGIRGVLKNYEPLFVSTAIQKAMIKVDETGTQAVAATALVGFAATSVDFDPPKIYLFNCDHPYVFYILLNRNPIFCGAFMGAK